MAFTGYFLKAHRITLPNGGTTRKDLNLPIAIIKQETVLAFRQFLQVYFLSCASFFTNDSSLCLLDIKETSLPGTEENDWAVLDSNSKASSKIPFRFRALFLPHELWCPRICDPGTDLLIFFLTVQSLTLVKWLWEPGNFMKFPSSIIFSFHFLPLHPFFLPGFPLYQNQWDKQLQVLCCPQAHDSLRPHLRMSVHVDT